MKIVICGSSAFRKEMIETQKQLGEMGHEGIINPKYHEYARNPDHEDLKRMERGQRAELKKQHGYIDWYFDQIRRADAILVLNYDKNGIANYVGGNTLMEMAVAYHEGKKIFLLHPAPEISYRDEILAVMTSVIDGDLRKIN